MNLVSIDVTAGHFEPGVRTDHIVSDWLRGHSNLTFEALALQPEQPLGVSPLY